MNEKWQTKEQMIDLLTDLVQYASITGSEGEVALAEYLYYVLKDFPYFGENPEYLQLHPLRDGRYFLSALVKKEPATSDTIVLLSHFDVVEVLDYGEFKNLAFRPHELTSEFLLRKELLPDSARKDAESQEWLFGRGTMDMKAGLTVQLSMLEKAMKGEFEGNILLLTVPDEEANSAGMIGAVPVLEDMKLKENLSYTACVNSEPMFARYPNDQNYYVYTGSIGKVLAGFYCSGVETHVGEPFSGLNSNLMVSEINRLLELNSEFCEKVKDEVTPPPTNLMQKDLKEQYSVQIPHASVSLFNLLVMKRSAEDLHAMLFSTAEQAAENIEKYMKNRVKEMQEFVQFDYRDYSIHVFSYDELVKLAISKFGEAEVGRRLNYLSANRGDIGDRDFSTKIVAEVAALCKDHSPMIVTFYSPPFYPAVSSSQDPLINQTVEGLIEYAKNQFSIPLVNQNYFAGLSDLSFLQLNDSDHAIGQLVSNMPLYGNDYFLPINEMKALNIPIVNVGPVGRDPHKWTERLHLPYTFETLPKLLTFTLKTLFEKVNSGE
ncbi:M20/M25/M40 family metallo-hydrolase [Metabacillus arenae]|uniref:M20/M25/M40 family metallo-hydrolase n=1 Tax=Metabacillus arenae TaxID=2771434 RepID=A0A926NCM1_9BACI|nr:M20/M25/M40 family metallo-hydrolase [Metabacillus arenae]MBD1378746.1 M20/M25/M40 family metallo-hydrolase [Metabacillus arenae]